MVSRGLKKSVSVLFTRVLIDPISNIKFLIDFYCFPLTANIENICKMQSQFEVP